jgi:G3E family GTPase
LAQSENTETSPTRRKPCGIIIISGFLGSGKTTLLKRFLDWELGRGVTPLVIMSEFGDFDVDGAIIADERLQIKAIIGGCVCCSNKDELADAITAMIGSAPGSRIYIETTGLADPAGVLATLTPLLDPKTAVVKKVLVVYDAARHGSDDRDKILVEKQILTADRILVNKCDLVAEGVDALVAHLADVNPSAVVSRTVTCDIDLEDAVEGTTRCFATNRIETISDNVYRSFAFQFDNRLYRKPFEKWLSTLPEDVVRVKGFIRFEEEDGIFEVQATSHQHDITLFPTVRWMDSSLVVIAHPMSADGLFPGLQACVPPKEH